jgi:hypothetical protein
MVIDTTFRGIAAMANMKLLKSLLIRAARTFFQTFLAILLASPVLNLSGSGLKAAAVAGLASVLSMVNRLLDETSLPSLSDATPAAAPAPATAAEPASSTAG